MALFRLKPGTDIIVTPSKSQYEINEPVEVNVKFHVEAKGIGAGTFQGWWTIYCEVYAFGKHFISGGDQRMNPWGDTDAKAVSIDVNLGRAPYQSGSYECVVLPKAHDGV